jgi:2-iminobutanoate/2-iminopropanoate deaminase
MTNVLIPKPQGVMMFTTEGKKIIFTEKAPKAIGPYSQAIRTESLVFTAGQAGLDPATGELVEGGIEAQTRQVLTNLKNVLEAADSGLNFAIKSTVFLKDMNDFSKMNTVYSEFFPENPPARSTIAAAALPKGALVEIEVIALLQPPRGD